MENKESNKVQLIEDSNTKIKELNPPERVQKFQLPAEYQFEDKGKKKFQRQLFEGRIKYTDMENQELKELKHVLKEKNQESLIQDWTDDQILRFIVGTQFDQKKCIQAIEEHNQWKKTWIPQAYNKEIESFLNKGVIYIQGRDACFRPILVMQLKKLNLKEHQEEFIFKVIVFLMEAIKNNMMVSGIVENMVLLMNFKDVGLTSIPVDFIKKLVNLMQNNYRSRLYRFYAVNTPRTISFSWNLVKVVLEESTVQKVNFVNKNKPENLFEHANPSQIEEQFGGQQKNKDQESIYWPPKLDNENIEISKYQKYFI